MAGALGGDRRGVVAAAVLAVLAGLAEAVALVVVAVVAVGLARKGTPPPFGPWRVAPGAALGVAAALLVMRLGLGIATARLIAALGAGAQADARREVLRDYFAAEWAVQSREERGRLQALIGTNAAEVGALAVAASTLLAAGLTQVVMLVVAVVISPLAAVAIVGVGVIVVAVLRPVVRRMRRQSRRNVVAERRLAGLVAEAVVATREARAFGVLDRVAASLPVEVDESVTAFREASFTGLVAPVAVHSLIMLAAVAVLAVLVAFDSHAHVAALGSTALVLIRTISYGQQVNVSAHRLAELAPNRELLAEQLAEYRGDTFDPGVVDVPDLTRVAVERVSFAYVPGRPVLSALDLEVARGEVVGVVGPSGVGKSTLVQLLLRLRRPTGGRILCDGTDLATIDAACWSRLVGFVPQDPTIFRGTVEHNVAFWRALTRDEVVDATRRAHLDDVVRALPDGYDTDLGGGDHVLSGGQLQRLAIARALAGRPRLLLLDEPTSALDAESEAAVRATLDDLRSDLATIVVAHRDSTIAACDRVVVLTGPTEPVDGRG